MAANYVAGNHMAVRLASWRKAPTLQTLHQLLLSIPITSKAAQLLRNVYSHVRQVQIHLCVDKNNFSRFELYMRDSALINTGSLPPPLTLDKLVAWLSTSSPTKSWIVFGYGAFAIGYRWCSSKGGIITEALLPCPETSYELPKTGGLSRKLLCCLDT